MIRQLKAILQAPSSPKRITLTPGRLFFLMSQELRQSRPKGRCNCSMPLPFAVRPADGSANWHAEAGMLQCADCREVARAIVARYRERYDANLLELGDSRPRPLVTSPDEPTMGSIRAFG